MSYSVIITETAKRELLNAVMYINNELKSPQAVLNLYNTADSRFHSLSEYPKRNIEINPFAVGLSGIHCIAVENYLAFYTVDDETMTVTIIRFAYNRRNWQSIIKTTSYE
ncbi:MAG: type II toxin-antitoxin system RelE/ParE family toxin [Clostridiales bacterium]|nr:type II toxin-antitoxin system RelE/ParE family toxin [Clostridiales bacterium]